MARRRINVDLYAGGGGASTGLEAAGVPVDVAINHDPEAIAVHKANHPRTLHLTANIYEVNPRLVLAGRKIGSLWASPDCTHFSVAKGGRPKDKRIRSLAWPVLDWVRDGEPEVLFMENVREFEGWGPLYETGMVLDVDVALKVKGRRRLFRAGTRITSGHLLEGQPIAARRGETFRDWRAQLELMGYRIEHRVLDASHYGAPTKRRRLFLVARRDGLPITWPEPTHGDKAARELNPALLPLRTAAECIDWSIPCPSIFERERPLAEKTLWRIAQGILKYVVNNPEPFIVRYNTDERFRGQSTQEPLSTLDTSNRFGVVSPHLVKVNHGRNDVRAESADEPLSTVTASRRGHAVVLATIDQGGSAGDCASPADAPLKTTTTKNRHAVIAPTLVQTGYGERKGQRARYLDLQEPLGTLMGQGRKHALVASFMAKHYTGVVGSDLRDPLATVTGRDHNGPVAATLVKLKGECNGNDPGAPMPTITAGGNHVGEVRAFLTTYYSSDGPKGQSVDDPLRTVTSKPRLGLVLVKGRLYEIVDIGMRMLEPHELLHAQMGDHAATYDLLEDELTKEAQVRLIGNMVCPDVAEALAAANAPRRKRVARAA